MPPLTRTWEIPPQTIGKHIVLRAYMGAWLAILGRVESKLVFIDGFAGPGSYAGGEMGSPLIALDVLETHSARARIRATVFFLFLEEDRGRYQHLDALLSPIVARLGDRAIIEARTGRFDQAVGAILDRLDEVGAGLAPAFVMVDPFGVSHLPMQLMGRILANKKAEVFVSFMYEAINRHQSAPEFEPHLDELFGTPEWRAMEEIAESSARKTFVLDLYEKQLRAASAKYVTRFELWDNGRFVYAIYFATSNALGCDRMKQAIWTADPTGAFQFKGTGSEQIALFGADFQVLDRQLQSEFGGHEVRIEALQAWMQTDATQFHSGHLKKRLKEMENSGSLTVKDGTRKIRGTYPPGTLLTIAKR